MKQFQTSGHQKGLSWKNKCNTSGQKSKLDFWIFPNEKQSNLHQLNRPKRGFEQKKTFYVFA